MCIIHLYFLLFMLKQIYKQFLNVSSTINLYMCVCACVCMLPLYTSDTFPVNLYIREVYRRYHFKAFLYYTTITRPIPALVVGMPHL